jgi:catechol 2,3-dioxygenase-like lactoylglutathione lyase family enzyme
MAATGPDFVSLQARDLDASQAFYEQYLGLVRSLAGPPHAVVFETKPIAFALGTSSRAPILPQLLIPGSAPRSGCTPPTFKTSTTPW